MRGVYVRRTVVPAANAPLLGGVLRPLDAVGQAPRAQEGGKGQTWRTLRLRRGHDSSRSAFSILLSISQQPFQSIIREYK